jgi:hypothetical protein
MSVPTAVVGRVPVHPAIPYPPSWIDRLTAWLDRSTRSFWVAIGIGSALAVSATSALSWLEGGRTGTIDPYWVFFGLLPSYELALIRHLDRVASDALDRFRPLLDIDDAAFAELRYRMTTLPPTPALAVALWIVIGSILNALYDPAAHHMAGVAAGLVVVQLAWEAVINALLAVLLLKIVRYLRDVDRVGHMAARVNLLDPGPIYAFSRLTSQAALGMLVLVAALIPTAGASLGVSDVTRVAVGFIYGAFALLGIASFALPLLGMHQRLVRERERLQAASSARLTALLGELGRDVDAVNFARADGVNKLLLSVLAEREVIAKLPTWPWQAATLRGFVSVLLLPVVVYLLARAAERVVL